MGLEITTIEGLKEHFREFNKKTIEIIENTKTGVIGVLLAGGLILGVAGCDGKKDNYTQNIATSKDSNSSTSHHSGGGYPWRLYNSSSGTSASHRTYTGGEGNQQTSSGSEGSHGTSSLSSTSAAHSSGGHGS